MPGLTSSDIQFAVVVAVIFVGAVVGLVYVAWRTSKRDNQEKRQ